MTKQAVVLSRSGKNETTSSSLILRGFLLFKKTTLYQLIVSDTGKELEESGEEIWDW